MKDRKLKNIFLEGAIPPEKIATSIAHHTQQTHLDAHAIFMGQVRAEEDEVTKAHAF